MISALLILRLMVILSRFSAIARSVMISAAGAVANLGSSACFSAIARSVMISA